jgi:ketosteroid isomerase-like protein
MSRENVEIVRQAIDAFNDRDLNRAKLDPRVVVDWSRSQGVEAGVYRGPRAARAFWETFHEIFDRVRVIPDQFVESGDQVFVPNLTRFRGRDGITVEAYSASVVTVRGGLILEWRLYRDRAEALNSLGLAESQPA